MHGSTGGKNSSFTRGRVRRGRGIIAIAVNLAIGAIPLEMALLTTTKTFIFIRTVARDVTRYVTHIADLLLPGICNFYANLAYVHVSRNRLGTNHGYNTYPIPNVWHVRPVSEFNVLYLPIETQCLTN